MLRLDAPASGWLLALAGAAAFPVLVGDPFYLSIAITALIFVALAVAFDLVVGRVGALSLTQPAFFGFGAYLAALLSSRHDTSFWIELGLAAVGAVVLALVIGIPCFRLSLHAFAIGTLAFAGIAQLVAQNWIQLTNGPSCATGVQALRVPYPGGVFTATTLTQQYFVILTIAAVVVASVFALGRSRLGLAFTAVRDDDTLASARGFGPTRLRLAAFGLSAVFTASAGVFSAHFQSVVCPTSLGFSYTTALLIMVFVGGRGSLRGVVVAAIVFTAIPQLLRVADEWRLAIFGMLLLLVVLVLPDGLDRLFSATGGRLARVRDRAARGPRDVAPPTQPTKSRP